MPLYQRKKRRSNLPEKNGGVGKPSNVMYLGNIPHGFYEQEIAGFFSQFGTIWKVKVCRSPKTGRSKGFGFVEFKHPSVAMVAAQAMNGYLLAEEILCCRICSEDWLKQRPALFMGWENTVNRKKIMDRKVRSLINTSLTESKYCKLLSDMIEEDEQIRSNIDKHGIDYQYTPYSSLIPSDNIYHTWLRNGKILPSDGQKDGGDEMGNLDASVELKKKLEEGEGRVSLSDDLEEEEENDGVGTEEDVSFSLKDWNAEQVEAGGEPSVSKDGGAGDMEVQIDLKPPSQKKKKKGKAKKKPEVQLTEECQGTPEVKKAKRRADKKKDGEKKDGTSEDGKGGKKKSKKRKNLAVDSSASGSQKKKKDRKREVQ